MKVEAEIYTVQAGKVTQLKINDIIYNVTEAPSDFTIAKVQRAWDEMQKAKPEIDLPDIDLPETDLNKGIRIAIHKGVPIHAYIVEQFKTAKNTYKLMKSYYPQFKSSSISRYVWAYRSYLGLVKPQSSKPIRPIKSRPKKKNFVKTYQTYVKDDEITAVRQAIDHVAFNYQPTASNIETMSGLPKHRCNAVLKLLKDRGNVEAVKLGTQRVYRWKDVND